MAENVFIHDSADKVPMPATGRHPLAPISGADFERPQRRTPWQLWAILLVVLLLPLAWLLWRLNTALDVFFQRYDWAGDVLLWLTLIGVVLLLLGGVVGLLGRVWLGMQHARIVRSRHGVPMDIVAQMRLDPYDLETQAIGLELARAQYSQYPNLSTLSNPGGSKASEALALPAQALTLIPDSEWLPWLNDAPHGLIAGSTGSGKTTLAQIALRTALDAGARGFIIDPKGKDWYGLPVIGAGRDFEAILQALDGVRNELDRRYQAYGAGERVFEPLIIVVDEVPDILQACQPLQGRKADPRWALFARSLGSLAREVKIRVWLLTQSPNVEDIGINGGMRSNYSRFALREKIPLLLNEDVDAARREQLRKLYSGQSYPVATIRHGQAHLLDVHRVPDLAQMTPRQALGWMPRLVAPLTADHVLRAKVRNAIVRGKTREQARAEDGLSFDNNVWSEVARESAEVA